MRAKVTFYGAGGGGGGGAGRNFNSAGNNGGGSGGGAGASMTFWNYDVSATEWAEPSGLYLAFGGAGGTTNLSTYAGFDGSNAEVSYYGSIWNHLNAAVPGTIFGVNGGFGGGGGLNPGGGGSPPASTYGPGGGNTDLRGQAIHVGNWVVPDAPATSNRGRRSGNAGQSALASSLIVPMGGVGAAPGFVPDIYNSTVAGGGGAAGGIAGPQIYLNYMTDDDYIYDGGGAAKYGGRWAAGGEGRNYYASGTPLPGGPGADGGPSGGGGGGGASQGNWQSLNMFGGAGGKGGDALMIIEWWL